MNDVGGPHPETGSEPIGVEIQAQAFAFARADALNNTTFYKYRIEYKGEETLTDAYITIFVDPDLGTEYDDDYIGSNPELGVGFVYNADNDDVGGFGSPPPALGYDFFQGPIVDEDVPGVGDDAAPDTLGMTKFGYYNNNDSPTGNPSTAEQYYNNMIGIFSGGQVWSEGGDGTNPDGERVDYIYPDTPGTYWSEPCATPNCSQVIDADDRRFIQSTGPFTMEPGDVQEVVFGVVWATGDENYNPNSVTNSVAAMFAADELAQRAFDVNFELPPGPPPPVVDAAVSDEEVIITWTADAALDYDQLDVLITDPEAEDLTYTFEGFEVFRFDSPEDNDPERIAIYDIENGVTRVINETVDLVTEQPLFVVVAEGTDSGLQFYYIVEEDLTNFRDYTYGVRSYAVSPNSTDKVLRSPIAQVTVRPQTLSDGTVQQANGGDFIQFTRTGGGGAGQVGARVVDPFAVVPGNYTVEYFAGPNGTLLYNVFRDGTLVFDGLAYYERVGRVPGQGEVVVEGLSFGQVVPQPDPLPIDTETETDLLADYAGDGAGIGEAATPGGDACPAGTDDPGCVNYGVNTVFLTVVNDTTIAGADTTIVETYSENSTDAQGQYFIHPRSGTDIAGISRFINQSAPDDFEMRFTQACVTDGCYAVYPTNFAGNGTITRVPFEIWNIGADNGLDDPADDYRMIPFLRSSGDVELANFADAFPSTAEVVRRDGSEIPTTDIVYFMVPDRPDGYARFEEAAIGFGGAGQMWIDGEAGDDIEDEDCLNNGYYVDYCYQDAGSRVWTVGDVKIADAAGDGTTPEVGTVIRFLTVPNLDVRVGDTFTFSTADVAALEPTAESRRASMDLVNVVPNPYRGRSVYEQGGESRAARFINLPDRATIRIFTLSGNLIRTLESGGESTLDWDLNTSTGLPVASGMYLVHVEGRDAAGNAVGEKVIKFGVVQREIRFNNF